MMNLTSPSQVKAWCIDNEFHPNRTLGQNFLIDKNILDSIVAVSGVTPQSRVLEIGPGLGVLTQALLATGAEVVAVEKDSRLAQRLAGALEHPAKLQVHCADALELPLDSFLATGALASGLAEKSCVSEPYFDCCVSNLPYSVGTRILINLVRHPLGPARITILVQTEVAERLAAQENHEARGLAGVWTQLDYEVRLVRTVHASCFWPRPEVGSTVVHLQRKPSALSPAERCWFYALTRSAFLHRRKQIGSTLRKATAPIGCEEAEVLSRFEEAHIDPKRRAETLTHAEWCTLTRIYAARCGELHQAEGDYVV